MNKKELRTAALPVVTMRGVVVFPDMTLHFDVGRKKTIAAFKAALESSREVFLVAQKDMTVNDPEYDDLYEVGVVGQVRHMVRLPESDTVRVAVEGKYRACVTEKLASKQYMYAEITELPDRNVSSARKEEELALVRSMRELFEEYADASQRMPPDMVVSVLTEKSAGKLSDYIVGNLPTSFENKQLMLGIRDPLRRAQSVCVLLAQETELMGLENDIQQRVQEAMDKNQREYFLREQLKIISTELYEDDSPAAEAEKYRNTIEKLDMPESSKKQLYEECGRFAKTARSTPEASLIRTYLDRCIALPWGKYTKDKLDIDRAKRLLDRDHYGLDEVKQRIIELMSVMQLKPDMKSQIICLVGPPGVGKTSIARSLAAAIGRKYARVALGGVHDEAQIRGHRKTYIGAMPGRIITALEQAGSANPLLLLDEIDKLGNDYKGDPSSALLEVLDSEQNGTFCDNYIEIPFDLSRVLFVTTANDLSEVPAALCDRMEIIELYSYTAQEKLNIVKKHLFPKQLKAHGLDKKRFDIKNDAFVAIIDGYTKEAGVRTLERTVAKLCRIAAAKLVSGEVQSIKLGAKDLYEWLGPVKYKKDALDIVRMQGAANGLAWTRVGGEIMQIEAVVLEGTGKLELTGSLGDVMKESAKAAVSYIRANSERLGVDSEFYKNKDIHIHAPEGAVPKDGPSAGVTMVTALVSALSGRRVRPDVAMTGEITLRGSVLPIGGLKEKTMAAYKAGMKTVIIPAENEPDLDKVDKVIKNSVSFVPVTELDQVLGLAIADAPKKPERVEKHPVVPECTAAGLEKYIN